MAIYKINDHRINVPGDMTADDDNMGPGAYDQIIFMGTGIITFECDPEPELYTGPFAVMEDNGEVHTVATLDEARDLILSLADQGRVYCG